LSTVPSQSSSSPLHVSAGAMQLPQAQPEEHVRLPVEPHDVVHEPVLPAQQPRPSSHAPLQSSSWPLQTSAGGEHTLQVQLPLQVRVPVVPQLVMHVPLRPAQQAKVSSHMLLQLSSTPLHASMGGVQAPHVQAAVQVRVPVVPQLVPHVLDEPGTHVKVSSIRPSQSSSCALQTSVGGVHAP
jgi:hypothetical protein